MKRKRISVSIDAVLVDWIDDRVEKRIFRNRSHGVEFVLAKHIEKERKE